MTTKYIYSMEFTAQKLANLIEDTIGRRPDAVGSHGNRGMSFTFHDTDVSHDDRQATLDALPEFMKLVYSFGRKVVEDSE